jgi:hypothetical protein
MHVVVVSFQKLLFIGRNSRALAHPSPLPLSCPQRRGTVVVSNLIY